MQPLAATSTRKVKIMIQQATVRCR